MKRGGFKPKAYERPPAAPLKPLTARVRLTQIGGEIVATPKDTPERSESYRRWVATLACAECGVQGFSQAAHPNQGRGLGQKASDLDCFALCCTRPGILGCHAAHDQLVGMGRETRRARELRYIERTRALAVQAGRPEIQP